jgi:hypothetical protein
MSFFSFDVLADEAILRAESDPEQAAKFLMIAAGYMRRGEVLPENVALHLADAIEASMCKPAHSRGNALLLELNLKALNQRPKAYWWDVGEFMFMRVDFRFTDEEKKLSQNEAAIEAAIEFKVSEASAVRYYKAFLAHMTKESSEIAWQELAELQEEERQEAINQAEHAIRQEGLKP